MRQIKFYLSGDIPKDSCFNPYILTQHPISQQILLVIRKEPKRISTIVQETNVSESLVVERLSALIKADLVRRSGKEFIINFVLLDNFDKRKLFELLKLVSQKMRNIIVEELPGLESMVEKSTPCCKQGFKWEDVKNTIVGGLVMDIGLVDHGFERHNIVVNSEAPLRSANTRYWFVGLESGIGTQWEFAHNIISDLNGGWGCFFCRNKSYAPSVRFLDKDEWTMVHTLMNKPGLTLDELLKETELGRDVVKQKLKRLCAPAIRCLSRRENRYYVNFPVFHFGGADKALLRKIDEVDDKIINEVCILRLDDIREKFEELKLQRLESQYGGFLKMFFVWCRDRLINTLISEEMLSIPPNKPLWNYWGWIGKLEIS